MIPQRCSAHPVFQYYVTRTNQNLVQFYKVSDLSDVHAGKSHCCCKIFVKLPSALGRGERTLEFNKSFKAEDTDDQGKR